MSLHSAQYVQPIRFSHTLTDEQTWEQRLLELGLDREAFPSSARMSRPAFSNSGNRTASRHFDISQGSIRCSQVTIVKKWGAVNPTLTLMAAFPAHLLQKSKLIYF
jgi:hypothetical protein